MGVRRSARRRSNTARAQVGDSEAALRHLHKAVDEGWQDADRLPEDEALAGLRGSSGWEALLQRLVG